MKMADVSKKNMVIGKRVPTNPDSIETLDSIGSSSSEPPPPIPKPTTKIKSKTVGRPDNIKSGMWCLYLLQRLTEMFLARIHVTILRDDLVKL